MATVGAVTRDGIKLVDLPSGFQYSMGDIKYDPHENFKPNGSFRLDAKTSPDFNQVNLVVALNLGGGHDEISGKLGGGHHSDDCPHCGRCYDFGVEQSGQRVRVRKEDPHPQTEGGPSKSINLGDLNNKWIVLQYLKMNNTDGSVNCQVWISTLGNDSTPSNNFQQIFNETDTGNWRLAPFLSVFKPSDSVVTCRVDGMNRNIFHYKWFAAVRITGGHGE